MAAGLKEGEAEEEEEGEPVLLRASPVDVLLRRGFLAEVCLLSGQTEKRSELNI